MEKVLIAITTAETVCHETMVSIYGLRTPPNVQVSLKIIHSYNVADGRNKLVAEMLQQGYDYIFFVDSDVILPENALVDLYNMKWYISVGTYPRKELQTITEKDVFTTLYWHEERNKEVFCPHFLPVSQLKEGKITPVDACGMGCVLIHRSLFDKLKEPYFVFAHEGNPRQGSLEPYCIGEDLYFCREVLRAGVQIWAHGSVLCGHVGKFIFEFPKRENKE